MGRGSVTFVGLGPDSLPLRTALAALRLEQAEVIVDADEPSTPKLIALARGGRRVVRTVRGDVFESPRALSEAVETSDAGIEIEIVPAVGAASEAGAFAGVVGRAVWTTASEVAGIVGHLPDEAPATLILAPGLASQRVVLGTCGDAAERAKAFGDVPVLVAFGLPQSSLGWFERRPLFGKRVLVTRALGQASAMASLLRERGAEPIVVPTIEIRPPSDSAPLDRALQGLRAGAYAWVAFTSVNGVQTTWDALEHAGLDARAFGGTRLAAIGPATARELERHGLHPDVVAKEFRGEGLAEEIVAALGHGPARPRVLLPRAARARDVLPDALRAVGCQVDVVVAYETHPPAAPELEPILRELELGKVDAVTFTSSSTVEHFCNFVGPRCAALLNPVRLASIGPVTSATAQARGLRVDVCASEYTVPGLVTALADSYR
jgi:uroporphyrinogen III methyltransferase / synthase